MVIGGQTCWQWRTQNFGFLVGQIFRYNFGLSPYEICKKNVPFRYSAWQFWGIDPFITLWYAPARWFIVSVPIVSPSSGRYRLLV